MGQNGPRKGADGAVGQGAPRGGLPLAAALAGGGAAHVAPDVGGGLACQVAGRDWPHGTLPVDGADREAADARRSTCNRLRATWQVAVGQWADVGGGSGSRGGRLPAAGRRGRLWLARGLTQAAGAGCEAGGPFGPCWAGLGGGLAVAPCPQVGRSGRLAWTGSRGPVQETKGVRETLAAPLYCKIAVAGSFRGRSLGR